MSKRNGKICTACFWFRKHKIQRDTCMNDSSIGTCIFVMPLIANDYVQRDVFVTDLDLTCKQWKKT